ncbi:MAG: RHS repeat-associated core domain-containing protein [Bacteroides sp.]|nr:RHS repeat-associated core domain-containing protein [Bacteroides sp.]
MKKKIYCLIALMILAIHATAQVSTQNYVRTSTMLDGSGKNRVDAIVYYDGLGRPFQQLKKAVENDNVKIRIATLQEYDALGREANSWLPIVSSADYIAPATFKSNAPGNYGNDAAPYVRPVYEYSPLNRVLQQYGPGSAWAQHPVERVYTSNTLETPLLCTKYTVSGSSLVSSGNYPAGELAVVLTYDEDRHPTYTFKDKDGKTLLIRQMNDSDPFDTYYVYDDLKQLRYVLSPAINGNIATANLELYAYRYEYDNLGRCSKKWLPGAKSTEYVEYVYDAADRVSFSQDGKQRSAGGNKWTFYLYDQLGRLTKQGVCTGKDASSGAVVQIQNFYDNYTFLSQSGFTDRTYFPAATAQEVSNAQNQPTGSIISRFSGGGNVYVANYYDVKGRVTRTTRFQPGFCCKRETAYTFTGNPSTVNEWQYKDGVRKVSGKYTYTYDYSDRLVETKFDLNHSGTSITLANYTYDNFGRLSTKKFHGNEDNKLTYKYNVRSWLTEIKGTKLQQNLYYNNAPYASSYYNGNICKMTWSAGGETTVRAFKYSYDNLGRSTISQYGEGEALSTNQNRFSEQVTGYDKNGNIKSLLRYGPTSSTAYGLIDNLTYTLTGNRVSRVDDAITAATYNGSFEFKDAVKQDGEYAYDANGNLTKDLNKGISSIQYNILNLPDIVTFTGGNTIVYTYAADGNKLKTVHNIDGTTTTTDYCGNVVYENGICKFLLFEEGYYSFADSEYRYYLKDHQGNNRVVINQSGQVKETNHYYPFGGIFASGTAQPYKYNGKELDTKKGLNWYDYGARHYDPALGRFTTVDPSSESYYETSLYTYCGNNPINRIDPTGADWYQNEEGNLRWQEGSESIKGYTNIGSSVSIQMGKDSYFNAYQNAGVIANQAVNAFDLIASSDKLQNQFLGKDSPLSEDSKSALFNSLNSHSMDAIARPVGEAIFNFGAGEFGGALVGKAIGWAVGKAVGKAINVVAQATPTESAVIKGITRHGTHQMITRGFKSSDILKIVREGASTEAMGRYGLQMRYTLNGNTVIVNAQGKIISVFSSLPGTKNGIGKGFINSF